MIWTPERQRAYMKDYYAARKENWHEMRDAQTAEQKASRLAKAREYYRRNKDKIRAKKRANADRIRVVQRNGRNLRKFGITPEIYDATLAAQNGECAICQLPMSKPVVDHCHETGFIRAFLCSKCNTAIGLFDEDVGKLRMAIGYLEAWDELKASKTARLKGNNSP